MRYQTNCDHPSQNVKVAVKSVRSVRVVAVVGNTLPGAICPLRFPCSFILVIKAHRLFDTIASEATGRFAPLIWHHMTICDRLYYQSFVTNYNTSFSDRCTAVLTNQCHLHIRPWKVPKLVCRQCGEAAIESRVNLIYGTYLIVNDPCCIPHAFFYRPATQYT